MSRSDHWPTTLDKRRVTALRRRLLAWFRRHHRQLPWRRLAPRRPNPYHVLVSEAMLQQTQVATVVDYFKRFIAQWPTLEALAEEDSQRVLRMWQGLGYYRRALHLHAAAKQIVSDHGGTLPRGAETLGQLPGVGRYTAGALASIVHGERAAIVDGNVARVLARWFAIDSPVNESAVRTKLWRLAEQLVPTKEPGHFNQALMELGAMVCTPRQPKCERCPVAQDCEANRTGTVTRLPVLVQRTKPLHVEHHIVAAQKRNTCLFEQRPADGMWSKMWQLPTLEQPSSARNLKTWIARRYGLVTTVPQRLVTFDHQTTHRKIRFVLWTATVKSGRLRPNIAQWRTLEAIHDLPLANPQRKALGKLRAANRRPF